MRSMSVIIFCGIISKSEWCMVENGHRASASRSDTVHLQNRTIGYGRAVPIILPYFTAVDGNEYAGYVIADLLQNAPDREIFIPRNFFSFGLYQCAPPRSHYNRFMEGFSQVYIN